MSSGQIPTLLTTTRTIMASPQFKRGLDDARKGVPFDWRVGGCDGEGGAWKYERGRLFGFIAPVNMPLWSDDCGLNPKAVALYNAARDRNLIL